ncbi:FKBP-type 22 kDa peptidyl-prolyl cis-trans isomerase [Tsuneonella dongtanensis]|uniref:Peptidyl-prolyl cis-trans isomerase n=1 Tax=Tsuneonella dongtanensis TaxID=692370 RepID=A0A1B2ACQ9_9SPHN|nr:FKBP-type peptidyl-prolyl cis-trans isomerase [Tsuneonella dongtanensis]ANY19939.1 FKBP-type 22 kDa peptidyl-prolyl cis-trans isomerase [Tsuneonella dongtanensis]
MTEITRVPLQPIAKGSLTKLWLGVIAAALLGAGIAWASVPAGVELDTITEGSGPTPGANDVVFIKYVGKLADGTEFDRSRELPFPTNGIIPDGMPMQVSGVVPGFSEGLQKMQKGGKYVLRIPADKGYGATPPPGAPIPPNADLEFEVELVDFMSEEDAQRRFQVLQQMMQAQQGGQAPGGAGAGDAPAATPAPPQ